MARLTLILNEKPGRVYRVEGKIRVGRDAGNDIQILDQKVSRRHVSIEKYKGFYLLRDLGSRNGTFLNDVKITEIELKTGDRIRIGNSQLVFAEEPSTEIDALTETDSDNGIRSSDDSIELFYNYRTFKDQLNRMTSLNDKLVMMDRISQLITLASNSRPLESASILYQEIQEILQASLLIDRSYIVVRDLETCTLRTEAVRSIHESDQAPDFALSVFDRVLREGLSILTLSGFSNLLQDNDARCSSYINAMCAPIRNGLHVIGLLYVDNSSPNSRFTENDLAFLSAIGNLVGSNISQWQVSRQTHHRFLSSMFAFNRLTADSCRENEIIRTERMASRAFKMCEMMGLPNDQTEIIILAAFIASRMIVSITPEDILNTLPEIAPPESHSPVYPPWMSHLPFMQDVIRLLTFRTQNFDGSGASDSQSGNSIPLGSRILRALLVLEELGDDRAHVIRNLKLLSGTILDPMIVRIVVQALNDAEGFETLAFLKNAGNQETDPISRSNSQERQQ